MQNIKMKVYRIIGCMMDEGFTINLNDDGWLPSCFSNLVMFMPCNGYTGCIE